MAQARSKGVDAREASWPIDVDRSFDVVLFSRSLHHMRDLEGAITAARNALSHTGRLLVQDFAAEAMDNATANWLADRAREAMQCAEPELDLSEELKAYASADNCLAAWREEYTGRVHTFIRMQALIAQHFESVRTKECPYLHRYFAGDPDSHSQAKFAARIYADEKSLCDQGAIQPLGRLLIAEIPA